MMIKIVFIYEQYYYIFKRNNTDLVSTETEPRSQNKYVLMVHKF